MTTKIAVHLFSTLLITSCARSVAVPTPNGKSGPSHPLERIVPGNVVHLTLKNGETLRNKKVTEVNSVNIGVLQDREGSQKHWQHFIQTIPVDDIIAVQKSAEAYVSDAGAFLVAEYSPTNRYYYFSVGQQVLYKITSVKRFQKGRITGVTDSTISFHDKKSGNSTCRLSSIMKIVIPNGPARTAGGAALMMTGIAAVSVSAGYEILAEAFQYENKNEAPIVGSAVLGIVAIVGGISLVHEMRMDLAGPWKLRVIKYQINP